MDHWHRVRCLIVSVFFLAPPAFAEDEPAQLLADLAPGTFLSFDFPTYIRGFSRIGSRSVFLHNENESLQALWVTDGTVEGTRSLGVVALWLDPAVQLGSTGGLAFYGVGNEEAVIWRTDGTPAGTFPVTSGLRAPGGFGEVLGSSSGGFLYFRACSPELGCELWSSDGSVAGTAPVGEIVPGPESGGILEIAAAGGEAFLIADERGLPLSPLRAAGALADGRDSRGHADPGLGIGQSVRPVPIPAGTRPAITAASGAMLPETSSVAQGRLYFAAPRIGDPRGPVLPWVSDGTDEGTVLLAGVQAFPSFTELDGRVFFAAADPLHGEELWSTDGTPGGTSLLLDIAPGLLGSKLRELTVWNGRLWFRARDAVHGMELWTSDGTAEGTRLVQDIAPGASWSTPAHLAPSEEGLYFSADDGEHGRELWVLYPY